MDEAKVMEVLRRVEWVGGDWRKRYCPWCERWQSQFHRDDCKLDALLREKEKADELTYPIMVCSVCKKLDGLCECEPKPVRWHLCEADDSWMERLSDEGNYIDALEVIGAAVRSALLVGG